MKPIQAAFGNLTAPEFHLIIKPVAGSESEGQSVVLMTKEKLRRLKPSDPLIKKIRALDETMGEENQPGQTILVEQVQNQLSLKPQDPKKPARRVALRVDVAVSDEESKAESFYAQFANDEEPFIAAGRRLFQSGISGDWYDLLEAGELGIEMPSGEWKSLQGSYTRP